MALNAADAGVAQAMSYLRSSGVRRVNCSPTCSANRGNSATPTSVTLGGVGSQAYKAWIEPCGPTPPTIPLSTHPFHRDGQRGGRPHGGPGRDRGLQHHQGVHARTISGGGSASVSRASVFSTGCVYDRSKLDMTTGELDVAYGVPVGVHSSQIITDSNGSGRFCPSTSRPIRSRHCRAGPELQHRQQITTSSGAFPTTTSNPASTSPLYPKYYGPATWTVTAPPTSTGRSSRTSPRWRGSTTCATRPSRRAWSTS